MAILTNECDIQKEITKIIKENAEVVNQTISPFFDLIGHFYNIPDTTSKSIDIIKDDTLDECIKGFSFSDKVNHCIKRFKADNKVKKTYIIENNINFISVNKDKDKEPVVRGYSFKDIEKYINKNLREYYLSEFKAKGKKNFETRYTLRRQSEVTNLLVKKYLRNLGFNSDHINSGWPISYFRDRISSMLPSRLSLYKCYTEIKPGKALNKIFDKVEATDSEEISNCIISFYSDIEKNIAKSFTMIKGEPIRYFYNERNYFAKKGNLGNSCMRYATLPPWKFDLYCKNPKNIGMLTYMNEEKTKVKGRAILWVDEKGDKYIDRVYYDSEFIFRRFISYCKLHNIKSIYSSNTGIDYHQDSIKVPLEYIPDRTTPYLDTFRGRIEGTNTIYTHNPGNVETCGIERNSTIKKARRRKSNNYGSFNSSNYSIWSSINTERKYTFDEFFNLYKENKVFIDMENLSGNTKSLIQCIDASACSQTAINAYIMATRDGYDMFGASSYILNAFSDIKLNDERYISSLTGDDQNKNKVRCKLLNKYIDSKTALYIKNYNDFVPPYINSVKKYQSLYFVMTKLKGKNFSFKKEIDKKKYILKLGMFPMYLFKSKDTATKVSNQLTEYATKNRIECDTVSFDITNEALYVKIGNNNNFIIQFDELSDIYLQYAIKKFLISDEKLAQQKREKESKEVYSGSGIREQIAQANRFRIFQAADSTWGIEEI
jgi:hypothetical protein